MPEVLAAPAEIAVPAAANTLAAPAGVRALRDPIRRPRPSLPRPPVEGDVR